MENPVTIPFFFGEKYFHKENKSKMLNTLIKPGEWQRRGKSEWNKFSNIPHRDSNPDLPLRLRGFIQLSYREFNPCFSGIYKRYTLNFKAYSHCNKKAKLN